MRPRAKDTIDSLEEVVYEKSIGTKMNDLDFRLEVVSRSCQKWRYIRRWVSRKPLEIEAWSWFQRTTIFRKWHVDYQMVKWSMTARDLRRCCEAVRSAIPATTWLLVTTNAHWYNIFLTIPTLLPYFVNFSGSVPTKKRKSTEEGRGSLVGWLQFWKVFEKQIRNVE